MNPSVRAWIEAIAKQVPSFGNVLEIGSRDINGSVRDIFDGKCIKYIGIDCREGKSVDVVANSHDVLNVFKEKFHTILCLEMLEHDDAFWITLSNIKKLLNPSGMLCLSLRNIGMHYHPEPKDYWRFSIDGAERLIDMAGCDVIALQEDTFDPGWLCLGRRRED